MSWKEFWLKLLHDYKPIVGAFLVGWHMKRPVWVNIFKRNKEEG